MSSDPTDNLYYATIVAFLVVLYELHFYMSFRPMGSPDYVATASFLDFLFEL
jgi:hypothetical protein